MFGVMEVAPKALVGEYIPKDVGFVVGLRGSTDQSITRGLVAGQRVFVCSNLAFNGDIKVHTKQTTFIHGRLPRLVRDAVHRLPILLEHEVKRIDMMKNFNMKSRWMDAALVEIHRQGGLTAKQLGKAIREIDQPSFDHSEYKNTAWYMHNAVTQALKPDGQGSAQGNMESVVARSQVLNRFIDGMMGLTKMRAAA
jgi:hypothetical protein